VHGCSVLWRAGHIRFDSDHTKTLSDGEYLLEKPLKFAFRTRASPVPGRVQVRQRKYENRRAALGRFLLAAEL
jgi:hypothetical protein